LADALGQTATQVRKDLACTGVIGRPKVGYDLPELAVAIEKFLGWSKTNEAFLVGAGHLGTALLSYSGFKAHGLDIVAAFDIAPNPRGEIGGKQIFPMSKLADLVRRMGIHLGVLAVPEAAAHDVAQTMIAAGIDAIWNFTPARLLVAPNIIVENVDLAQSLAVLSHKLAEKRAQRWQVAPSPDPTHT